jgi:hypothetical protein
VIPILFINSALLFAVEPILVGFSQDARIEPRDSSGLSINFFFNEYFASQDQMEVGYAGNTADGFFPTYHVPGGDVLRLGNNYRPGFQVGFGGALPIDHWSFGGEYLWYRGHAATKHYHHGTDYYMSPLFVSPYNLVCSSIDADWHLALDLVDFFLTRPYYEGKRLTVEPVLGIKLGSIRQNFDVHANVLEGEWESQEAITKSRALGIGPKFGCQSNYLIGKGFAVFGDLAGTFFYSKYTKNKVRYSNFVDEFNSLSENGYSTLRPIMDAGVGLSWKGYFGLGSGSYNWHKTFYMSLSCAYNFSLFFSQNVTRGLIATAAKTQATPGNLYLQGFSVGIDFIF